MALLFKKKIKNSHGIVFVCVCNCKTYPII